MVAITLAFSLQAPAAVQAHTDLRSLLAEAPSADWIETGSSPTVLEGEFTSQSYVDYLRAAGTNPGSTKLDMDLYGFRDGYAREWEQRATNDLLIERAFEFADSRGAGYWYSNLRVGAQTSSHFTSDVPDAAAIPNSFGALLTFTDVRQWRVEFKKGNVVYVVHMDGGLTEDLSAVAVRQAGLEYSNAPASTTSTVASAQPFAPQWVMIMFAFIALAVVVIIVGAVVLTGRRRLSPAPALSGPQMSADGAYWWDGARWRDAKTDVPPWAQRSPDGAYWWDGAAWRQAPR